MDARAPLERAREAAIERAAVTSGHAAGCRAIAKEAIDAFLSDLGRDHVIVPREPDAMYASDMGKQLNSGVSVQAALKTYLRNAALLPAPGEG